MTTEASHPLYVPLRAEAAPEAAPEPVLAAPVPALRLAPDRLRTAILAGAGAVALLWGVQARPSARLDAFFASGAHLTGLLAGYGVLVLLLLMARVPAVKHGVVSGARTGK
ncbi:Flavodoxin reductases (ferredoxin-NADPH reductases) family 1, partial [Streptomyces venezuelae ATCC 10712]